MLTWSPRYARNILYFVRMSVKTGMVGGTLFMLPVNKTKITMKIQDHPLMTPVLGCSTISVLLLPVELGLPGQEVPQGEWYPCNSSFLS